MIFSSAMARFGPFGRGPRLAVAVSGGADSTALALLAHDWARAEGGDVLALIVDHGLRAESADEAALTAQRFAERGIASRVLTLAVAPGPGVQARARAARHAALTAAARAEGRLFLLLGHQAGDQAETVAMRAVRGAGGAEGIAGWAARHDVVLLRPLLGVAPAALRDYLRARGMGWVEDPSNANPDFERVRVRQAGTAAVPDGAGARQARECEAADFLAAHCEIRAEGYALINAPAAPPAALGALLRVIGGAAYAPGQTSAARLAAKLRPATLGGARIAAAGRLGPGWLLCREPAACAPPVPAMAGAVWDNRFTLLGAAPGAGFGALGDDAKQYRKISPLPAVILRAQPCLRGPEGALTYPVPVRFSPPAPATSHPFVT